MFSIRFSCSVSRACETFIWAFWSCSSKCESISIAMSEDLLTNSPSFTRYSLRIALVVDSTAYWLVLGGLWFSDVECVFAVFERLYTIRVSSDIPTMITAVLIP